MNVKTGGWLHGFEWLKDEDIGGINEEWNWLDGWSSDIIKPKNVHFTTGGPWFSDWEPKRVSDASYAGEWQALHSTIYMDKILREVF